MRVDVGEWWSQTRMPFYQASREVAINAAVTLTPVWAGIFLSLLLQELSGFWPALQANTARGDLFLLATAVIAPLTLYLSVRREDLPKPLTLHFPGGWFFIVALILLFGTSAILFAVKRIADLPNSTIKVDHDLFIALSFILYVLSIALALVVTVVKYRLDETNPEEIFRADTRELLDGWSRRRR